jgi:transcriptional regulator with XRE-family HTH domain
MRYNRGMTTSVLAQIPATLALVGLRELRQERVLSQRELAERAGVSPKTILDIEQNRIRPQPGTIRKIAAALGMEPAALAENLRTRQTPMFDGPEAGREGRR